MVNGNMVFEENTEMTLCFDSKLSAKKIYVTLIAAAIMDVILTELSPIHTTTIDECDTQD